MPPQSFQHKQQRGLVSQPLFQISFLLPYFDYTICQLKIERAVMLVCNPPSNEFLTLVTINFSVPVKLFLG